MVWMPKKCTMDVATEGSEVRFVESKTSVLGKKCLLRLKDERKGLKCTVSFREQQLFYKFKRTFTEYYFYIVQENVEW